MKAVVCRRYGPPEVLEVVEVVEVEKPAVPDDGVLVRVHASSVNPADFFSLSGTNYIARMLAGRLRPRPEVVGHDFAGTVESVGSSITDFQPGDEVFGGKRGAFVAVSPAGPGDGTGIWGCYLVWERCADWNRGGRAPSVPAFASS